MVKGTSVEDHKKIIHALDTLKLNLFIGSSTNNLKNLKYSVSYILSNKDGKPPFIVDAAYVLDKALKNKTVEDVLDESSKMPAFEMLSGAESLRVVKVINKERQPFDRWLSVRNKALDKSVESFKDDGDRHHRAIYDAVMTEVERSREGKISAEESLKVSQEIHPILSENLQEMYKYVERVTGIDKSNIFSSKLSGDDMGRGLWNSIYFNHTMDEFSATFDQQYKAIDAGLDWLERTFPQKEGLKGVVDLQRDRLKKAYDRIRVDVKRASDYVDDNFQTKDDNKNKERFKIMMLKSYYGIGGTDMFDWYHQLSKLKNHMEMRDLYKRAADGEGDAMERAKRYYDESVKDKAPIFECVVGRGRKSVTGGDIELNEEKEMEIQKAVFV